MPMLRATPRGEDHQRPASPLFGWIVVVGSGFAAAFGSFVLFAAGYAAISAAIAADAGWGPTSIAFGATLYLLFQAVAQPLCAHAVNVWGARQVALASILLFGLTLLAFSMVGRYPAGFFIGLAALAITGSGTNGLPYARTITGWFSKRRGLALGISGGAAALGLMLVPLFTERLVRTAGWSMTLRYAAVLELAICLPVVAVTVWERRGKFSPSEMEPKRAEDDPIVHFSQIAALRIFWLLAAAFFFLGLGVYAVVPNTVTILFTTGRLPLRDIAIAQSITGPAFLLGRLLTGYLLDRITPFLIGAGLALFLSTQLLLYATAPGFVLIVAAAALAGFSVGGEGDLMPYIAAKFFPAGAMSTVFGLHLFAFFIGATLGPFMFTTLRWTLGGIPAALVVIAAMQVIPLIVFLGLARKDAMCLRARMLGT